jgi:hypothetical protein
VSLQDALNALSIVENQEIDRAVGNLLRARAVRDDWRQCSILQQLETGRNINVWNELFRRTRQALANEADLPRKAQTLLRPNNSAFDVALEDFIAEMMAVLYLSHLGHADIRFLAQDDPITADLASTQNGMNYITEAKNLREPISLAYVAFRRWHHNRAADPERFNFTVELLRLDDPFEDLTPEQAVAVRSLIDSLPERNRPSEFQITLPEDRVLRLRIVQVGAGMIHHGGGPFLVNEMADECSRAVFLKLLEPMRKALTQLYSSAVPNDYRRLLFVRWKPPDSAAATGETDGIRVTVRDCCQQFVRRFFPNFALTIAHTYEDLENVPHAEWQ